MRLIIAWAVFIVAAAVSRWGIAPALKVWSADALEAGGDPLPLIGPLIGGAFGGAFFGWVLPVVLIVGALSVTVSWAGARRKR